MTNKFFTYILLTENNKLYCGWTIDPEKRLTAHKGGMASKYTRANKPLKYVYLKEHASKSEAMSEECRIKRLSRKEKDDLINKEGLKYEQN